MSIRCEIEDALPLRDERKAYDPGEFCPSRLEKRNMIELFKQFTIYLATGIEAAAAVIVGLAACEASVKAVLLFLHRREMQITKEDIRLHLGRWLALAIEFELAADILRTAMTPTWNEIGQLAAIIVIRTVLNYFLQKDIDAAEKRRADASPRDISVRLLLLAH
jgi:uncharacterized membrane protein